MIQYLKRIWRNIFGPKLPEYTFSELFEESLRKHNNEIAKKLLENNSLFKRLLAGSEE